MRRARAPLGPTGGLPIAAYLGLLVALALAAAFVAVLAVVLWLPPRPPDVMRADVIADQFQAGYDQVRAVGEAPGGDGMVWSIRDGPPSAAATPHLRMAQRHLARRLRLSPRQVRVAAANIVRNEMLVFRVRGAQRHRVETHIEMHGRHVVAPPPPDGEPPELPEPPDLPPMFAPAPAGVLLLSGFEIGAQLPDGRWLVMRQGQNRAELGWIGRAALIIAAALAVLSVLAILFARRLTRPIRNFADAVQAVGVNPQSAPVREEGPLELRGAARAVNAMQARLRALIADRTKTLAAVAHDMRTPLMRLRLAAEHAPAEQRDRMAKEIEEVEALVASFIAFARDDPAEEARVRLDLSALLQSIADDQCEAGKAVSFAGEERVIVTGQSLGLKRLFNNLIDNALKYGASARIVLKREAGAVSVDIADDGPGIPPDQRENVFEPFVRLENGERGNANGAGLGLPAARSIARAQGGDVRVLDCEKGALLQVRLPA